jgi:hypothetical protein
MSWVTNDFKIQFQCIIIYQKINIRITKKYNILVMFVITHFYQLATEKLPNYFMLIENTVYLSLGFPYKNI